MPRSPSPLPAALAEAPFTFTEARQAGVSRQRLRASDLVAPFPGVRVSSPVETFLDRCRAYAAVMPPNQAYSHWTAAVLLGIPIPWRWERDETLHVMAFAPDFPPQGTGVRGHLSDRALPVLTVSGLSVVVPERVLLQLAPRLSHRELVRAGDHLVRRRDPLSDLERLRLLAATSPGVRGIRAFRSAVARTRSGTDSPRETDTRLALVDAGLPEPVIGFRILSATGGYLGTPDLAYPDLRVAIEYEGDYHRERAQFAYDIRRRERMEDERWAVVRVISDHLESPSAEVALARRVEAAMRRQTFAQSGLVVASATQKATTRPDSAEGEGASHYD